MRRQTVLRAAANGGAACPSLSQSEPCNADIPCGGTPSGVPLAALSVRCAEPLDDKSKLFKKKGVSVPFRVFCLDGAPTPRRTGFAAELEVKLSVGTARIDNAAFALTTRVYNGAVGGPTIAVARGTRLRIALRNECASFDRRLFSLSRLSARVGVLCAADSAPKRASRWRATSSISLAAIVFVGPTRRIFTVRRVWRRRCAQ